MAGGRLGNYCRGSPGTHRQRHLSERKPHYRRSTAVCGAWRKSGGGGGDIGAMPYKPCSKAAQRQTSSCLVDMVGVGGRTERSSELGAQ